MNAPKSHANPETPDAMKDAERNRDSETPTQEIHPTSPCAALLSHVAEVVRMSREVGALRAYLISATCGVVFATTGVASWLLLRGDSSIKELSQMVNATAQGLQSTDAEFQKGATERAIAIGVLQTRMANVDAALSRLEAGQGKLEGKVDALLAARSNGAGAGARP